MENLVEEKYYDLILNLVRQHRRYESCKTIENDIVDDVLKRLQPVLKDIHDEAIIESYLQKLVSNSIITISHKNNIPRRNISKPALFDNIVNQEKPVEVTQKQEEHLELENELNEPNELNESVLDLTEDNLEENSEISEKAEEFIEVPQSEESIQPEVGLSEEKLVLDEISDNVEEQNVNDEEGFSEDEVIMPEQDLADSNNIVSLNEASDVIIENNPDNIVEDEKNEFSSDFSENKDNNDNCDELFELNNEINSDFDLDSVDDLTLDFNDDNVDEIKNMDEHEESGYLDIFEVDNKEENILPKEISSMSINYDCFDIKLAHEDFSINDKEAIIADIINVNKSHPELNLIEIFKLKYNEHKTVKEIAQELKMSEDDVIIGINKLIDISKD